MMFALGRCASVTVVNVSGRGGAMLSVMTFRYPVDCLVLWLITDLANVASNAYSAEGI